MSTPKRIKVGNVTIDTSDSHLSASVTLPSSTPVALSTSDTIALTLASEMLSQHVRDSMLIRKGRALERKFRSENPSLTDEQLKDLLLETLPSGEASTDGSSSSEWMLQFVQANVSRPDLMVAFLCELHARQASARHFFLAYVYSNCDNIQANLHYFDYSRAQALTDIEHRDEKLLTTNSTLVADLHDCLRIDQGSESQKLLWAIFAQGALLGNDEDLVALTELAKTIRSRDHFFALASLATSLRPSALFHFFSYLALHENQAWHTALALHPSYVPESLATHHRIIQACYATLCQRHEVPHDPLTFRLSVKEVTETARNVPMHPDGQVARAIAGRIDIEGLSQQELEDIQVALHYLLKIEEIKHLSQASAQPN